MDFRKAVKDYTDAPISRHLVMDILSEYKRPNDKISELVKNGELIAVRRGLYLPGPATDLPSSEPFLVANHLRGPSYVSMESALAYWGFIPERVYEISSVTMKTSKKYTTPVGRFSYYYMPTPYYSFGVKRVELVPNQVALVATPEKALCDKILNTSGVMLRSVIQTRDFLIDDLRIDVELVRTLDATLIQSWIEDSAKKNSLEMLVKTIQSL